MVKELGMIPEQCMLQQCHSFDINRIKNSELKASDKCKTRRKRLRAIRKAYIVWEKDEEGEVPTIQGHFSSNPLT